MKKVLIISPYFPPCNTPDMQRIRMSLPYFEEFGWKPHIVCVDPKFCDVSKDTLLCEAIPTNVKITYIKPIPKKWTNKLGLGSIAIRSLFQYGKTVNYLLKNESFDLIYFSTTQFPVCILGYYWNKRYGIPYVIDMQDPWHSDFYKDKPKKERPPKYWFSHRLNKWLEPIAMKRVSGIIAVSKAYIDTLKERYSWLDTIPAKVITFGAFEKDFELAKKYKQNSSSVVHNKDGEISIVYVGRGGFDMKEAISLLFDAFKFGLETLPELFEKLHFYFIGTSYAPSGNGIKTIYPVAEEKNISKFVTEITDRIPFYQSLNTLLKCNLLFIAGSNDPQYTASKIYPYILSKKPLLAIFHSESSAAKIINECNSGTVITFDMSREEAIKSIKEKLTRIILREELESNFKPEIFYPYTAKARTLEQTNFFNYVLKTD